METIMGSPVEPVISTNECYAALTLMRLMCQQIEEHGDVPQRVYEVVSQFAASIQELKLHPTGKDDEAVPALIRSGLLPGFQRSPEKEAGKALLQLIAARGTKESQAA